MQGLCRSWLGMQTLPLSTNPEDMVGKRIFDTHTFSSESPAQSPSAAVLGMGQVAKIAHNYITLANNLVARRREWLSN